MTGRPGPGPERVPELGTVLVTGAGGAAAVTLLQALAPYADLVAADLDPYAVGLHLVPPAQRVLLPRGDSPDLVPALLQVVRDRGVDLVVPTVDVELLAVSRARDDFHAVGAGLLVEDPATLEVCLDKLRLADACAPVVRVSRTFLVGAAADAEVLGELGGAAVLKPRAGAGGRGVSVVRDAAALARAPHDGTYLAQELLPGDEYSIDVLARPDGHVVAAVPRLRDKVDSGVAVAARTVRDTDVVELARRVATTVGVRTVVNVQARRAADGEVALLEVNPRFPGTMSLTRAAGVDMPVLAARAARGATLPETLPYRDVAVVRHWHDVVVPVDEYAVAPSLVGGGAG